MCDNIDKLKQAIIILQKQKKERDLIIEDHKQKIIMIEKELGEMKEKHKNNTLQNSKEIEELQKLYTGAIDDKRVIENKYIERENEYYLLAKEIEKLKFNLSYLQSQ